MSGVDIGASALSMQTSSLVDRKGRLIRPAELPVGTDALGKPTAAAKAAAAESRPAVGLFESSDVELLETDAQDPCHVVVGLRLASQLAAPTAVEGGTPQGGERVKRSKTRAVRLPLWFTTPQEAWLFSTLLHTLRPTVPIKFDRCEIVLSPSRTAYDVLVITTQDEGKDVGTTARTAKRRMTMALKAEGVPQRGVTPSSSPPPSSRRTSAKYSTDGAAVQNGCIVVGAAGVTTAPRRVVVDVQFGVLEEWGRVQGPEDLSSEELSSLTESLFLKGVRFAGMEAFLTKRDHKRQAVIAAQKQSQRPGARPAATPHTADTGVTPVSTKSSGAPPPATSPAVASRGRRTSLALSPLFASMGSTGGGAGGGYRDPAHDATAVEAEHAIADHTFSRGVVSRTVSFPREHLPAWHLLKLLPLHPRTRIATNIRVRNLRFAYTQPSVLGGGATAVRFTGHDPADPQVLLPVFPSRATRDRFLGRAYAALCRQSHKPQVMPPKQALRADASAAGRASARSARRDPRGEGSINHFPSVDEKFQGPFLRVWAGSWTVDGLPPPPLADEKVEHYASTGNREYSTTTRVRGLSAGSADLEVSSATPRGPPSFTSRGPSTSPSAVSWPPPQPLRAWLDVDDGEWRHDIWAVSLFDVPRSSIGAWVRCLELALNSCPAKKDPPLHRHAVASADRTLQHEVSDVVDAMEEKLKAQVEVEVEEAEEQEAVLAAEEKKLGFSLRADTKAGGGGLHEGKAEPNSPTATPSKRSRRVSMAPVATASAEGAYSAVLRTGPPLPTFAESTADMQRACAAVAGVRARERVRREAEARLAARRAGRWAVKRSHALNKAKAAGGAPPTPGIRGGASNKSFKGASTIASAVTRNTALSVRSSAVGAAATARTAVTRAQEAGSYLRTVCVRAMGSMLLVIAAREELSPRLVDTVTASFQLPHRSLSALASANSTLDSKAMLASALVPPRSVLSMKRYAGTAAGSAATLGEDTAAVGGPGVVSAPPPSAPGASGGGSRFGIFGGAKSSITSNEQGSPSRGDSSRVPSSMGPPAAAPTPRFGGGAAWGEDTDSVMPDSASVAHGMEGDMEGSDDSGDEEGGMGGAQRWTAGAVGVGFSILGTSFAFVAHRTAATPEQASVRLAEYRAIVRGLNLHPTRHAGVTGPPPGADDSIIAEALPARGGGVEVFEGGPAAQGGDDSSSVVSRVSKSVSRMLGGRAAGSAVGGGQAAAATAHTAAGGGGTEDLPGLPLHAPFVEWYDHVFWMAETDSRTDRGVLQSDYDPFLLPGQVVPSVSDPESGAISGNVTLRDIRRDLRGMLQSPNGEQWTADVDARRSATSMMRASWAAAAQRLGTKSGAGARLAKAAAFSGSAAGRSLAEEHGDVPPVPFQSMLGEVHVAVGEPMEYSTLAAHMVMFTGEAPEGGAQTSDAPPSPTFAPTAAPSPARRRADLQVDVASAEQRGGAVDPRSLTPLVLLSPNGSSPNRVVDASSTSVLGEGGLEFEEDGSSQGGHSPMGAFAVPRGAVEQETSSLRLRGVPRELQNKNVRTEPLFLPRSWLPGAPHTALLTRVYHQMTGDTPASMSMFEEQKGEAKHMTLPPPPGWSLVSSAVEFSSDMARLPKSTVESTCKAAIKACGGGSRATREVWPVDVHCQQGSWRVLRSTEDVYHLAAALQAVTTLKLPPLPPLNKAGKLTTKARNNSARRKAMQAFLSELASSPLAWRTPLVAQFLDNPLDGTLGLDFCSLWRVVMAAERVAVQRMAAQHDTEQLFRLDSLAREMATDAIFMGFSEQHVRFPPTHPLPSAAHSELGSHSRIATSAGQLKYDGDAHAEAVSAFGPSFALPGYANRVLRCSALHLAGNIKEQGYSAALKVTHSHHRPVSAHFQVTTQLPFISLPPSHYLPGVSGEDGVKVEKGALTDSAKAPARRMSWFSPDAGQKGMDVKGGAGGSSARVAEVPFYAVNTPVNPTTPDFRFTPSCRVEVQFENVAFRPEHVAEFAPGLGAAAEDSATRFFKAAALWSSSGAVQVDTTERGEGGLQQDEGDSDSSDGASEGGMPSFGIPVTVQTPRGGFSPSGGGSTFDLSSPRSAAGTGLASAKSPPPVASGVQRSHSAGSPWGRSEHLATVPEGKGEEEGSQGGQSKYASRPQTIMTSASARPGISRRVSFSPHALHPSMAHYGDSRNLFQASTGTPPSTARGSAAGSIVSGAMSHSGRSSARHSMWGHDSTAGGGTGSVVGGAEGMEFEAPAPPDRLMLDMEKVMIDPVPQGTDTGVFLELHAPDFCGDVLATEAVQGATVQRKKGPPALYEDGAGGLDDAHMVETMMGWDDVEGAPSDPDGAVVYSWPSDHFPSISATVPDARWVATRSVKVVLRRQPTLNTLSRSARRKQSPVIGTAVIPLWSALYNGVQGGDMGPSADSKDRSAYDSGVLSSGSRFKNEMPTRPLGSDPRKWWVQAMSDLVNEPVWHGGVTSFRGYGFAVPVMMDGVLVGTFSGRVAVVPLEEPAQASRRVLALRSLAGDAVRRTRHILQEQEYAYIKQRLEDAGAVVPPRDELHLSSFMPAPLGGFSMLGEMSRGVRVVVLRREDEGTAKALGGNIYDIEVAFGLMSWRLNRTTAQLARLAQLLRSAVVGYPAPSPLEPPLPSPPGRKLFAQPEDRVLAWEKYLEAVVHHPLTWRVPAALAFFDSWQRPLANIAPLLRLTCWLRGVKIRSAAEAACHFMPSAPGTQRGEQGGSITYAALQERKAALIRSRRTVALLMESPAEIQTRMRENAMGEGGVLGQEEGGSDDDWWESGLRDLGHKEKRGETHDMPSVVSALNAATANLAGGLGGVAAAVAGLHKEQRRAIRAGRANPGAVIEWVERTGAGMTPEWHRILLGGPELPEGTVAEGGADHDNPPGPHLAQEGDSHDTEEAQPADQPVADETAPEDGRGGTEGGSPGSQLPPSGHALDTNPATYDMGVFDADVGFLRVKQPTTYAAGNIAAESPMQFDESKGAVLGGGRRSMVGRRASGGRAWQMRGGVPPPPPAAGDGEKKRPPRPPHGRAGVKVERRPGPAGAPADIHPEHKSGGDSDIQVSDDGGDSLSLEMHEEATAVFPSAGPPTAPNSPALHSEAAAFWREGDSDDDGGSVWVASSDSEGEGEEEEDIEVEADDARGTQYAVPAAVPRPVGLLQQTPAAAVHEQPLNQGALSPHSSLALSPHGVEESSTEGDVHGLSPVDADVPYGTYQARLVRGLLAAKPAHAAPEPRLRLQAPQDEQSTVQAPLPAQRHTSRFAPPAHAQGGGAGDSSPPRSRTRGGAMVSADPPPPTGAQSSFEQQQMLEALHSAASDLRHLAAAISGVPTHTQHEGGGQELEAPPLIMHREGPPAESLGLREQYMVPQAVEHRRVFSPRQASPPGHSRPRRAAPLTPLQDRSQLVQNILSPSSGVQGRGFAHGPVLSTQGGADWRRAPPPQVTSVADLAMGKRGAR